MTTHSNKIDVSALSNGVGVLKDFQGGMQGHERRSTLHATLLHLGIRIKYFFVSCFLLKPFLFSDISAYPSVLRPKGIPRVDWATLFGIRVLWLVGGFLRTYRVFLFILSKLRIMHVLGWCYERLLVRKLDRNTSLCNKLHKL